MYHLNAEGILNQIMLSIPITHSICGHSSVVEYRLAKARVASSNLVVRSIMFAPLAQLDRAFDYESKGREFESLRARHFQYSIGM
ncbi:hypothetical protein PBN151_0747 [Paenibacillus sp. NAIST15-1]|nr:hypothetical protein PBN151_0747 [Paenibacillus sp. NAIST15-1]